jgi:hypothetical protein
MEDTKGRGMIFSGVETRARLDWGLRLENGHNEDKWPFSLSLSLSLSS